MYNSHSAASGTCGATAPSRVARAASSSSARLPKKMTFEVTPQEICFRDFEPHKTYEAVIQLKNTTKETQFVRVARPQSRFIALKYPRNGVSTTKVASGLSLTYKVLFTPEENHDYTCDLLVTTDHEEFTIPVQAIASRGRLELPDSFVVSPCPVRGNASTTLFLRNTGLEACQWRAEAPEPFSLTPSCGIVPPNGGVLPVSVHFSPPLLQNYNGTLAFLLGPEEDMVQELPITGEAVEVEVELEQNSIEIVQTFVTLESQVLVRVHNHSDHTIHFIWKSDRTDAEEQQLTQHNLNEQSDVVELAVQNLSPNATTQQRLRRERLETLAAAGRVFNDDVFTIEPLNGTIYAKCSREFVVAFNPQLAMDYLATAYLVIDGRQNRLPLQMRGTGIGPQCELEFTHLDIGDICVGELHTYEVNITNRGCIEARYSILPAETLMGGKFTFSPSTGVLAPGESEVLTVRLKSDIVGLVLETFRVHLHGSLEDLRLRFRGRITGPSLRFDVEELDFGNVSYNCKHSRDVHMMNTGEVPIHFHLRVADNSAVTIEPSSGIVNPSETTAVSVDFVSNTVGNCETMILVDVEDVGDAVDSLPVRAACIVPALTLSMEQLHYGVCFVGHAYTMNLEVVNATALVGKFEVILLNKDVIDDSALLVIGAPERTETVEVIESRSRSQVPVTLTPLRVGEMRLSLYVRVLGSDEPPLPVLVTATARGPTVALQSRNISFGTMQLLERAERDLVVHNTSPIPAHFISNFVSGNGNGVFEMDTQEGEIPPESSTVIKVSARLDDARTFNDRIKIQIKYNDEPYSADVSAVGKGYALVPVENTERVDFGDVFTETQVEREITLINKGRRDLAVLWSGIRASRAKPGGPPVVFHFVPESTVILSGNACTFKIQGMVDATGDYTEEFVLKDKNNFRPILHCTVMGTFITPIVAYSTKRVNFEYIYGVESDAGKAVTTKTFTMRNTTTQPLQVNLKRLEMSRGGPSPFSLEQPTSFTLQSNETRIVGVTCNALYRGDSIAHTATNRLLVSYANHPSTEFIGLMASIALPTIQVEPEGTVNFGSILVDTEGRSGLKLINLSKTVTANFHWSVALDGDPPSSTSTNVEQRHTYFDFVPFRGSIAPGETRDVEAVFYGIRGRHEATATCHLEGGPSYEVKLVGWSDAAIKFDCTTLDFGVMHYLSKATKTICITSPSRVAVPFAVDLSLLRYPGAVSVTPVNGAVINKIFITVNFSPLVPDEIVENFYIQVGHKDPQLITVRGLGQVNAFALFSSDRHISLSRFEDMNYQRCKEELAERDWVPYHTKAGNTSEIRRLNPVDIEAERVTFCRNVHANLEAIEEEVKKQSKKANVIELKNRMKDDMQVILAHYVVDFGHMTRLETRTTKLILVNTSMSSVSLTLEKRSLKSVPFVLEPMKIPTIPPFGEIDFNITLAAFDPEKVNNGANQFEFYFDILKGPRVVVEIRCFVATPVLVPSESSVDFGGIMVGHIKKMALQFTNNEAVPCTWRMTLIEGKRKEEENRSPLTLRDPGASRKQFKVNADHGTLSPGSKMTVEVSFMPRYTGPALARLRMRYTSNQTDHFVQLKGCVTCAAVTIAPTPLIFPPVFPCQAVRNTFTITNNESQPVEVFSMNADEKHKTEVSILRLALARKTTGEHALYLPLRGAGESLPIPLVESLYTATFDEEMEMEYKGGMLELESEGKSRPGSRASARHRSSIPPMRLDSEKTPPTNRSRSNATPRTDVTLQPTSVQPLRPHMVVLTGPPSSGKTKQTRLLAESLHLYVLDLDAMVQAESELDSAEGELIRNILSERVASTNLGEGTCSAADMARTLSPQGVVKQQQQQQHHHQQQQQLEEKLVETPAVMVLYALMTRHLRREEVMNGVLIDDVRSKLTDNREAVLLAMERAAVTAGMDLHFVSLAVSEVTTGLRQNLAIQTEFQMKVNEALTLPLTEEEYERISEPERDVYNRRLLYYNQCKRALADVTKSVTHFATARESETQQTVQALVEEDVAAREQQEALLKASMKGKKFVPEPRPKPVWEKLTELDQYKELYMLLRKMDTKTHIKIDGEANEEDVMNAVAGQILPSMDDTVVSLTSKSPSPPPPAEPEKIDYSPESCTYGEWELIDEHRVGRVFESIGEFRFFSVVQREVVAKKLPKTGTAAQIAPTVEESTRWIVPPNSSVNVTIVFCSDKTGEHTSSFIFGVTGSSQEIVLEAIASTAYPEIIRDEKSIFLVTKPRVIPGRQLSKVFITSKRIYDFGPLIIPGGSISTPTPSRKDRPGLSTKRASDVGIIHRRASSIISREGGAQDIMKFTNSGIFPAEVALIFSGKEKDKTFSATPNKFTLPVGEMMEVVLRAVPESIGEITTTLVVTVRDNPTPWYVNVSCIGTRPAVAIDGRREAIVQYGRCLIMRDIEKVLSLANVSSVPVRWRISGIDRLPGEFILNCTSGTLDVNAVQPLSICFKPIHTGIHNVPLKVDVTDAEQDILYESLPLTLKAEAHDVVLEWTRQVDFKLMHVGETRRETIRILNKGPYDVGYLLRLPKCLQGLITLSPNEGTLRGLVGFKDAALANIEVTIRFDKEGEIPTFLGVIEASFFDPFVNELLYPVQNIPVSAEAWYNRFVIKPSCIDFGSCVSEQKKQSTFELRNTGRFPLTFRLFNYKTGPDVDTLEQTSEETGALMAATSTAGGGGGGAVAAAVTALAKKTRKQLKVDQIFQLGAFTVSPSGGTVEVGGSFIFQVTTIPGEKMSHKETLGIYVDQCEPEIESRGVPFDLVASPTTPGIVGDLTSQVDVDTLFEEQQVVTCLAQCNMNMRAFAREERIFTFGASLVGSRVTERFRIANSSPLLCTVRVQLLPKYPRDTKENKKEPFPRVEGFELILDNEQQQQQQQLQHAQPQQTSMSTSMLTGAQVPTAGVMEKVELPPFESRFVSVCFNPTTLQTFGARFEAFVVGGTNPKTSSLHFDLTGEGILPTVEYILPPRLLAGVPYVPPSAAPTKKNIKLRGKEARKANQSIPSAVAALAPDTVQLPLTLVGSTSSRTFTVRNTGSVRTHIRLMVPDDDLTRDLRVSRLREDIALPVGGEVTFELNFTPTEVEKRRMRIHVSVRENPYEDRDIWIVAESYFQPISFDNIDPGSEDHLTLGNLYLAQPKDHSVIIRNNSSHAVRFEWDIPFQALTVTPCIGNLAPGAWRTISFSFQNDTVSHETLQCPLYTRSISIMSDDALQWDDAQVKYRWMVANDDELSNGTESDATRRNLRKVAEPVPEPPCTFTGEFELQKVLYVTYACEPTSYKLTLPMNEDEEVIDAIVFPLTKIFQRRSTVLRIRNTGKNILPFAFGLGESENGGRANVFTVDPVEGRVEPNSHCDVRVTFAPHNMENVNQILTVTLSYAQQPKVYIPLRGTAECPQIHFNIPQSDYLSKRIDGEAGTDIDPETVVVQFSSCGQQMKVTQNFKVINPSTTTYRFEWISDSMSERLSPFRCLTPSGSIAPGKQCEMIFEYTSTSSLSIRESKWSFIVTGLMSVPFLMVGKTEEPQIFFHQSKLQFGGVTVGTRNERVVELENCEDLPFPFAFDRTSLESGTSFVTVKPMSGTIPPKSTIPVTVSFYPKEEVSVNTRLICRVKRMCDALSINVKGEGLRVHTSLRIENDEDDDTNVEPIDVQPGHAYNLNLGRVQVDTFIKKRFILTNDGKCAVDYSVSLPENRFIQLSSVSGTIAPKQRAVLVLNYAPTAEEVVRNFKIQCRIDKSNLYVIRLSVVSYIPKLNLSFTKYEFGPCFITEFSAGSITNATLSMMNGEAKENTTLDCLLTENSVFELDASSFVLRPGEVRNVKVSFTPREVGEFSCELKILLNGSYPIYVPLTGEGVVPRIDVHNRFLKLGIARIGERRSGEIRIDCRSRTLTPVSLANCADTFFLEKGVTFSPSELFVMRPREARIINVFFKPTARMPEFQHEAKMVVCGREMPFAIISGSCEDAEVHLDVQNILFSDVVAGATATRRVVIMNSGDISQRFKWDLMPSSNAEMKVVPASGVVRSHAEQTCEFIYSPKKPGSSFRRVVAVEFDNAPPLSVNVEAHGAERPQVERVLEFTSRARGTESRTVPLENPTDGVWTIKPVLDNKLWTTPKVITINPRSTASLVVTYSPLFASKTKDTATLFIPLPSGSAHCFQLEGLAMPASDATALTEKVIEAGSSHWERFEVQNATSQPLCFAVSINWTTEPERGALNVKVPVTLDVPARQSRECVVTFSPFREGIYRGTVICRCAEREDHTQSFDVLLKVVPKAVSSRTELVATVRNSAIYRLPISNHLQKPVTLSVKVENGGDALFVDSSITIPPKGTSELAIRFFPLIHKEYPPATVTATNAELGVTTCKLNLRSNPPAVEKVSNVSCPLGQTVFIPLYFLHFCKSNCDFVVRIPSDSKTTPFSKTGTSSSVKVPGTTRPEGQEVLVEIQYEPTSLGETREMIEVFSPQAGLYVFPIVATCVPPQPLGPVVMRPGQSMSIPFKNVFYDPITINVITDSPVFIVNKAMEQVASKKVTNIQVQYKAEDEATAPQTGKLTVKCAAPGGREGETLQWVYYLKKAVVDANPSLGITPRRKRDK